MALDLSAQALAERLTMAGLEVEGVETTRTFAGIFAARIVGLEPHPNADRLALCTVEAGERGTLRVVSGAPNLEAGLRVAVAFPGARLADERLVEAVEIRGVTSEGNLVSEREVGISEDASGVM
ncbi:MAG: phenylalanine--tRNA ligase subunit beta, partial [Candidatus Binatia bacterium]